MGLFTIDPSEIAELGTTVALYGAMRADGVVDDIFELIVGITTLVYELYPGS